MQALRHVPTDIDAVGSGGGVPGGQNQGGGTEERIPLDQPQVRGSFPLAPTSPVRVPGRFLRPPGAVRPGEADGYETLCQRCGHCVDVCPPRAIRLDLAGLMAEGAPYILPDAQACVVCDSLPCISACPSGALALTPLDRTAIRMGTAKPQHGRCLRAQGEECRECVRVCPLGAETIGVSAGSGRIVVKIGGCIGCGQCEQACPVHPPAIMIRPAGPIAEPLLA